MEYSEFWNRIKDERERADKYKIDRNFEDKYLSALVETTNDFELVWKLVGSQKAGDYNLEVKLENEFIKTFFTDELICMDSDELWNFVSRTSSSDIYEEDIRFENNYDELMYDSAYSSISLKRSLQSKYMICSEFEDIYKEAMISVTDREPQLEVVAPSKAVKKREITKNKQPPNLKNLLNQRLQRLKLEEETIDCQQLDSEKSLIFTCKFCGVQSKRKRRLFVSHVIPKHIKIESKLKKKGRKRKSKQKLSFKSEIKREYICPDLNCAKKFNDRSNRKRHMLKNHSRSTQKQKLECGICGETFSSRGNFVRHTLQFHRTSTEPKKCPLCNYVTNRSDNF